MDGDRLVLAFAEEDWDYAINLAKTLSNPGRVVFLDDYDLSALQGRKLFQYLDDLVDRGASHILLLLSRYYVRNQTDYMNPAVMRYIFRISDNYDMSLSPPWINCIKRSGPRRITQGRAQASSRHPLDQASLPDRFHETPHPVADNLRRLPDDKDKYTDRQNKRRLASVIREAGETVIRELEEAIWTDSANPAAYTNLGNALWCRERYDEAYQNFQNAIKYDPGNAVAYNGLGSTCWCQERYNEALQYYEEAARLGQPDK